MATESWPVNLVSSTVVERPARDRAQAARNDPAPAASGKPAPPAGETLPAGRAEPAPEVDLAEALERLAALARRSRRNLSFRVDEASGRTVITVTNAVTNEVVRQIPADEVLALARQWDSRDSGVFVEDRA